MAEGGAGALDCALPALAEFVPFLLNNILVSEDAVVAVIGMLKSRFVSLLTPKIALFLLLVLLTLPVVLAPWGDFPIRCAVVGVPLPESPELWRAPAC